MDKSNNNYVEIAFKIIQPENPAVIAIYHEGKALPDTPFKFAAIESIIILKFYKTRKLKLFTQKNQ